MHAPQERGVSFCVLLAAPGVSCPKSPWLGAYRLLSGRAERHGAGLGSAQGPWGCHQCLMAGVRAPCSGTAGSQTPCLHPCLLRAALRLVGSVSVTPGVCQILCT